MVNLICGPNGSGKTQKLMDRANEAVTTTKGLIAFIDKSNKLSLNIDSNIRFIDASEFPLDNTEKFLGFICGLISGNYDFQEIYIDNIKKITKPESLDALHGLIHSIADLSQKNNVVFNLTLDTCDGEGMKFDEKEVTYLK